MFLGLVFIAAIALFVLLLTAPVWLTLIYSHTQESNMIDMEELEKQCYHPEYAEKIYKILKVPAKYQFCLHCNRNRRFENEECAVCSFVDTEKHTCTVYENGVQVSTLSGYNFNSLHQSIINYTDGSLRQTKDLINLKKLTHKSYTLEVS
jgi:hypothetical protein